MFTVGEPSASPPAAMLGGEAEMAAVPGGGHGGDGSVRISPLRVVQMKCWSPRGRLDALNTSNAVTVRRRRSLNAVGFALIFNGGRNSCFGFVLRDHRKCSRMTSSNYSGWNGCGEKDVLEGGAHAPPLRRRFSPSLAPLFPYHFPYRSLMSSARRFPESLALL